MRAIALGLALFAAGCGQGRDAEVNSETLERIAIQHNESEDIEATARLEPVVGIVAPPAYAGRECRFTRDGDILIHAFSAAAAARVNGVLRVLRVEGPVGPTGGFFRDRELAISIGVEPGLPARVRVTNRATQADTDVEGQWQCGQAAG